MHLSREVRVVVLLRHFVDGGHVDDPLGIWQDFRPDKVIRITTTEDTLYRLCARFQHSRGRDSFEKSIHSSVRWTAGRHDRFMTYLFRTSSTMSLGIAFLMCTTPLVINSRRKTSSGVSFGQGLSQPISDLGRCPSLVPMSTSETLYSGIL